MSIIKVDDLLKKYGSLTAVDKISFEVKKGEIFGILGPNGAGKTTTLEMIEGLRQPDGGSIQIDNNAVWPNPKKVKRIIGVQLQSTSLFDYLRVAEIIKLFASFYSIKLSKEKLNLILEDVSLTNKAKAYVNELSGGQQQRLSIALALVNEPKVVFLDEPTTGLDPQARRSLWDVIKRINKEGKAVVLTTHYMEEAQVLCKRIAIMDKAKIIDLDTPANLIKKLEADSKLSFSCKPKLEEAKIKGIKGVTSVQSVDHSYMVYSSNIQKAVSDILKLAKEKDAVIEDIHISGANLEDVFLNMTGRALRD
ncbi:MAG: ABC transporter ATP-binding protein [Actinobacteria bacterium]|nr:MAG: ABC transporter ATP-binding protein [Actinomycetota bacterium]